MEAYFLIGLGVGLGIAAILTSHPGQFSILDREVPEPAGVIAVIALCPILWPVALVSLAWARITKGGA